MYSDSAKLDLWMGNLNENFGHTGNYKLITESVSDIISRHTLDGRCTYLSPSCIKILGYDPKSLIGVNLLELLHPDDVGKIKENHNLIIKNPMVYISTYRMKRKDGDYVWLETSNVAIRDKYTNEVIEIVCVSRNITDRIENKKMLEKMVTFSEELLQVSFKKVEFQKILENLLDISKAKYGVLNLYNESGNKFTTTAIAGINGIFEKASKLFGFEMLGKEWDDDAVRNERTNGKIITRFESLSDLVGTVVNPSLIGAISKVFRLGEVFVVKIIKDDKMIGDFTMMMSYGEQFENEKLVEIYSRQIGMFITRKRAEEALEQREKVLQAISDATKILLVNSDFNIAISKVLKLLGSSTGVDRVSFFEVGSDDMTKKRFAYQKAEWSSDNGGTQIDRPKCQTLSFEVLDTMIPSFLKGTPINVIAEDLQECNLKNTLDSNKILSVLVLPIFVKNIFWGFIAFGDCKNIKKWSESEISTLHIFVGSVSKAIERKLYEAELEFLGYHDNLTGLFNRRKFADISNTIDKSGECPVSVIVGDVNGLKLVNDAFGHACGDTLLVKVAEIIKKECGENASVARRGGDEFAAILPGVTYNEASAIIERITRHCEEETTDELIINISFGAETKIDNGMDLQSCYNIAEDRMYSSKLLEGKSIRNKIIENFRAVMEEKTGETRKHCERMAELSKKFGKTIGLRGYEIENLKLLSLLHDIGKTGIPDSILLKPGKLDEREMSVMKKHSEIGFRIASTLHELLPIADGILSHHERWDGNGYPHGLKAERIPLLSRIVSILDTYDAMTSDRPYRKALSVQEAIDEIKRCAGTQFDPYLVDAFINDVL